MLRFFLEKLIRKGALDVEPFRGRPYRVGEGEPACVLRFLDARAALELALDPGLKLGELYMNGRIEVLRGDIYDLLALVTANLGGGAPTKRLALAQKLRQAALWLRAGIRPARARANVAHHYDLDGRLYRLFLDEDMQYSCAYFEGTQDSLDAAQTAKKRHIAAKLAISPGQKILDIGCGWGGLGLYLARHCDADVLGVTLSTEQLASARERARAAGFGARTRFELQDYRAIGGRFDRIVSVGMFEHVGPKNYDDYFGQIARLLADDGVALVHTIAHFAPPSPTNAWVTKYIFPDGYLPGLAEIMPSVARAGLVVADLEMLRDHYALTLAHWRARFLARRDEAKAIYDERFCRMWEFYLACSECGFRFQGCAVAQLQLVKRLDALPITRDYIARNEEVLRQRERAFPAFSSAAE